MGIHGLRNFFKNCIRETDINNFLGDVLLVDTYYQLFRYAIAYRKNGTDMCNPQGKRIIHIWAIIQYSLYLLRIGINPYYVFDGKSPELKKDAIEARNINKIKALNKLFELDEIKDKKEFVKNFKKTFSLTGQEIKECIELLEYMGIPHIRAKGEADICCALLSKSDNFHAAISNDTDLVVFGLKRLLMNFSGKKSVEELCLKDIYDYMQFKANEILLDSGKDLINDNFIEHRHLVEFSILLGSDYTPHIKGFSNEQIFQSYVLNDFSMENTIVYLNNYILGLSKNNSDFLIPENFIDKAKEAKKYYMEPDRINCQPCVYQLKKPNRDKLIDFLCNKNGFEENSVYSFVQELEKLYLTMESFNKKKHDNQFKSFRGYQFKYYQNKYKNSNLSNSKFINRHKSIKTNVNNNHSFNKKNINVTNKFSALSGSDCQLIN